MKEELERWVMFSEVLAKDHTKIVDRRIGSEYLGEYRVNVMIDDVAELNKFKKSQ